MRMTARSVSGSSPTSVAGNIRPSANATSILSAACTTWLFVSRKPSGAMIKPEPLPPLLCWPSLTFTLAHPNVNHSRFNLLDNSRHRQGIPVEQFIVIDGRLGRCLILRRIEAVAESANDFSLPPTLRCIEYFHVLVMVM